MPCGGGQHRVVSHRQEHLHRRQNSDAICTLRRMRTSGIMDYQSKWCGPAPRSSTLPRMSSSWTQPKSDYRKPGCARGVRTMVIMRANASFSKGSRNHFPLEVMVCIDANVVKPSIIIYRRIARGQQTTVSCEKMRHPMLRGHHRDATIAVGSVILRAIARTRSVATSVLVLTVIWTVQKRETSARRDPTMHK